MAGKDRVLSAFSNLRKAAISNLQKSTIEPSAEERRALSAIIETHGGSWIGNGRVITSHHYVTFEQRRRSTLAVVEVESGDLRRRVVVKAAHPSAFQSTDQRLRIFELSPPDIRLKAEYAALCRLAETNDDGQFFAVQPLGIYEQCVLVMEWRPEPSLADWLADRSADESQLIDVLGRTGAWLRRFHGLTGDEAPAYDSLDFVTVMLQRFASQAASSTMGRPFRGLAQAAIERSRLLELEMPMGLLHGDMAPRNILVDGAGRVGGIDVAAKRTAPILHDIAAFVLALRVGRHRVARASSVRVESLVDSFLVGYGLDGAWQRHLDVFFAFLLLDRANAASVSIRRVPEWLLLAAEARRLDQAWRLRD